MEKCHFQAKTMKEKEIIQNNLKSLIIAASKKGILESKDWSKEPLVSSKITMSSMNELMRKDDEEDFPALTMENQTRKRSKISEPPLSEEMKRKLERAKRFDAEFAAFHTEKPKTKMVPQHTAKDVMDWDEETIVGTCETLEKKYFRLTSAPNPCTVRPLPILKKTLALLKQKWRNEGDYNYICDQFKSMRQDLTVQRIKNEFTVQVYEIHARIALEKGDLGEYNQCQTQLKSLYDLGIPGNLYEFLAYRILYFLHTRNHSEISNLIGALSDEEKENAAVKHSLLLRAALSQSNYCRFFQLVNETPNMGAYLLDHFVNRERISALKSICKAYRPDIELEYLERVLGFDDTESCVKFFRESNFILFLKQDKRMYLDTKASLAVVMEKVQEHSKIDIKGQI